MPFHLLGGEGIHFFLLSAAKPTCCTLNALPSISKDPCHEVLRIGMQERKIRFLENSVRLAIFRSLNVPLCQCYHSRRRWTDAFTIYYRLCPRLHHIPLKERLSHREDFSSADNQPHKVVYRLSSLMYSRVILKTGSPPVLMSKNYRQP